MRIEDFEMLFGSKPFILDGAAGTKMIEFGMPAGVCPEQWASRNLDKLAQMHTSYIGAGAQAIYAFTFGANSLKLAEFGLEGEMHDINMKLCEAACEAAHPRGVLVGGDISPTGDFIQPFGELDFDEAVQVYYDHARVLAEAGADFLIIETMQDIQNARAALIGAKEACSLPVCVSMTYDESGHTLTGSTPEAVAATLCALGVNALGANCGIGPDAMLPVIEQLNRYSNVPIFAKPNAGLPTGDKMPVQDYVNAAAKLVEAGASAVGGCCGTSYEHIAGIKMLVSGSGVLPWGGEYSPTKLSSLAKVAEVRRGGFCTIGERINPTGKKDMQAALRGGDMESIVRMAADQRDAGADIIDVNVGMSGIDEVATLKQVMLEIAGRVDIPLCLDSANAHAMEPAIRAYPGRALVNSISAESGKAEELFPLVAKYGSMYILLPLDDTGVPGTAEGRIDCINSLLTKADEYGIPRGSAIVDALVMPVGSDAGAGRVTLDVISWCAQNGLNCMMGISNVSFGLPERQLVNAAMLSAGISRGMNVGIVDVCNEGMRGTAQAARVLVYSEDANTYAGLFTADKREEGLFGAILSGDKGNIDEEIEKLVCEGCSPNDIMQKHVIASLDKVGELFSEKKLFLPQLMASAEAAKASFAKLEPMMAQSAEARATAVIATVKGDIHDIGKNIVALMLRNHGFNVIDLGRDVPNERILDTAERERADIIGLSALITTTMPRMGECAEMMRQRNMDCVLMVGGAVVTRDYAAGIGALYSKDAAEAVEVAKNAVRGRGGLA